MCRIHIVMPIRADSLECAFSPSARIVISNITPAIDEGCFAVKRTTGDELIVEANIFADGHEQLGAAVLYKKEGARKWSRAPLEAMGNDRWRATLHLGKTGLWQFYIEAWLDEFGGFVRDVAKKREAGLLLSVENAEGRALLAAAHAKAGEPVRAALNEILEGFDALPPPEQTAVLLASETRRAMQSIGPQNFLTKSFIQPVRVDRKRAGFASWYELFPRSQSGAVTQHGTFHDVIAQLPRIRKMGFDVLYMPPIHPIGTANRKGRNNALSAASDDPGSPYAIGASEGGHDAVHPQLGSLEDFRALVAAACDHNMEVALDFAVQMSPDHPWVKEHPKWFKHRPDGSIKYAENPPKKYEDIVNPDFYADKALWIALRDVIAHWIAQGVHIFRVDNPHTKPLPFWQWLIADIRRDHPDVIFLAEAFTRPNVMYQLAKVGFDESYTYFTWRNTKAELTAYMTELASPPVRDFFRPHFFVNTPDINPVFLQTSGRAGFLIRAALAATLSGLWGLYSGFEICESEPLPGREEYKDSEKYELRQRDFEASGNIAAEIAQLNALRSCEPALQTHIGIRFYNAFNDNILYFGKSVPGSKDMILVAINLDPHHEQACDFEIPLWEWGLPDHETLQIEDLLHGYKFTWSGKNQRISLAPSAPYAIWRATPQAGARP